MTGPALAHEGQELRQYVVQYRWSAMLIALLTIAAALLFSLRAEPVYESQAKVLIKGVLLSPDDPQSAQTTNMETEKGIATSLEVAELAAEELGSNVDPEDLLADVSASYELESEILSISFKGPSQRTAQKGAQAFADAYLDFRLRESLADLLSSSSSLLEEIETLKEERDEVNAQIDASDSAAERATLQSQAALLAGLIVEKQITQLTLPNDPRVGRIVQKAGLPEDPISPNHVRAFALGLFLGLALGIAQAAVRGRLDDRFRTQEELEMYLGAAILATVPEIPAWRRKKAPTLITDWKTPSAASESFRILRTNLIAAAPLRGTRTLMITSSRAGEGKTAVSTNLAIALAQADQRVILVSADLRKPRLHQLLDKATKLGLAEVLSGHGSLDQALTTTRFVNLTLLASESTPHDAAELLGSNAMAELLKELSRRADFVLLDAAPLSTADTVALTTLVDSVVIVVDAGRTFRRAIGYARRQLDRLGAHVLGAVLNNFDPSKIGETSYYHAPYMPIRQASLDGSPASERVPQPQSGPPPPPPP